MFVLVKVNYSEENTNDDFFAQLPEADGYPHFYVFDSAGNFLHSQNIAYLEAGDSYDADAFLDFISQWASN